MLQNPINYSLCVPSVVHPNFEYNSSEVFFECNFRQIGLFAVSCFQNFSGT